MQKASGGAIVFIASDAAFGQIRQGVYGATKAAMVALARTTAREHGRHGIRADIVCPGLVLPEGPEAVGAASLWAVGQDSVFDEKQIDYAQRHSPCGASPPPKTSPAPSRGSLDRAARQVTGQ